MLLFVCALQEEQKAALLCQHSQENLRDFTEIIYRKLSLPLILVEPKLLELVLSLETTRDEHIRNRTKLFGHPEVTVQDGEKVLMWSHHDAGSDKTIKSIVDYSLPLTVFGSSQLVCQQWRTSFALFYKDGIHLKNGTAIPKLVSCTKLERTLCAAPSATLQAGYALPALYTGSGQSGTVLQVPAI